MKQSVNQKLQWEMEEDTKINNKNAKLSGVPNNKHKLDITKQQYYRHA
jgi:hypothetical protein